MHVNMIETTSTVVIAVYVCALLCRCVGPIVRLCFQPHLGVGTPIVEIDWHDLERLSSAHTLAKPLLSVAAALGWFSQHQGTLGTLTGEVSPTALKKKIKQHLNLKTGRGKVPDIPNPMSKNPWLSFPGLCL